MSLTLESAVMPHYFINKILLSKYIINNHSRICVDMPINMKEKISIIGKKFFY